MVGNAYLYNTPAGFVGRPTRQPAPLSITQGVLSEQASWVNNGVGTPVVFGTGGVIQPVSSTTTSADIYGIVASFYGGFAGLGTDDAWDSVQTPVTLTNQIMPIMRFGYIAVKVQNTTQPKAGGKVYIRVAGTTSTLLLGGFEAAADSTASNTIEFVGAVFTGGIDRNGVSEISFSTM